MLRIHMRIARLWATKSHREDENMPTQHVEVKMGPPVRDESDT